MSQFSNRIRRRLSKTCSRTRRMRASAGAWRVCLRAQRLYRAIEAPAEYIEAVAVGAGTDGLRDDKRAQHLEAVSAYRNRYGAK